MANNRRRTRRGQPNRQRQGKQIDVLPDEVLLGVFDFHVDMSELYGGKVATEGWQSLVHVCRRWRKLVFESPRRLNLQLFCTPETPVMDTLDIWPTLPLIVGGNVTLSSGTDNTIAALGQSNRICRVDLDLKLAGWQLEHVLATMRAPFPELTHLRLFSDSKPPPIIPDSFLGGFAPHLRTLTLNGVVFPALPKLPLSATHLVYLSLYDVPLSGYISPEAMVALLCTLSSLETLYLGFQSPQSRPDLEGRRLPPRKRSILPALDRFHFKGVTEYLEELVTHIDAPRLNYFFITFFNQIDFDTPRLAQFVNRTRALEKPDAHVNFYDWRASVLLPTRPISLEIAILCREPGWQLSSIEQLCNSFHLLSTVEDLYIEHNYLRLGWKNNAVGNTVWLQLLHLFTAVEKLYLPKEFAPDIAAALQELVGGRIAEVLPSLQNIFVERLEPAALGPFQENIGKFIAARQKSNHPVAIFVWDKGSSMGTV